MFPYKTLIIVLAILGAMFIFKDTIEERIGNSENVNILGVQFKFKVDKNSQSFEKVQDSFHNLIEHYKENNLSKDQKIESLRSNLNSLIGDIDDCESALVTAEEIEQEFSELEQINETIQQESEMISEAIKF